MRPTLIFPLPFLLIARPANRAQNIQTFEFSLHVFLFGKVDEVRFAYYLNGALGEIVLKCVRGVPFERKGTEQGC